jgi:uncharacterized tellurite resistance protein B-like protein
MLERFQKLFRALSPDGGPRFTFEDSDQRLAAAALLVHVTLIDGVQTPDERRKLSHLLMDRFDLEADETEALIAAATARDKEAVDFDAFARMLKRQYDEAGRQRLIEMMWELAFADGVVHQFEDAELIAVPSRERIAIRKRIAAERGVTLAELGD